MLFNFFLVACHLDPKTFIRLWHAGERLVGYAILSEDPLIDWQVLPDYEWRGIEDELMVWAQIRLVELRAQDAPRWGITQSTCL